MHGDMLLAHGDLPLAHGDVPSLGAFSKTGDSSDWSKKDVQCGWEKFYGVDGRVRSSFHQVSIFMLTTGESRRGFSTAAQHHQISDLQNSGTCL